MEIFSPEQFRALENPSVTSVQLLSPLNSQSRRVTITRVTVEPGAEQDPHQHPASEQIWVALAGGGTLLLGGGQQAAFRAGQVARFADGDVHGFRNTGAEPFIYISVTSPPIDFSYAHQGAAPRER